MPTPVRRRLRLARRWVVYLLAIVLVLMALVLGAASQLLPLAERHPDRIAAWLSEKAGRPVSFERVQTRWTRRGPLLQLEGLHIGEPGGGVGIGQAEVLLSMYAGLLPGRSFTELRLRGPSLTLERADDGRWSVLGLPMTGTADPLDYLEGLGELQVIGGQLEVRAPQLGLRTRIPKIDLRVRVDGRHVSAGALAWIRPDAAPAALAFEFDRDNGSGRTYFDLDTEALGAWAPLLHHGGIAPADGRGRVEAWAEMRGHRVVLATTRFQLRHVLFSGAPLADGQLPQVRLDEVRGRARWRVTADGWRLDAPSLRVVDHRGAQTLDGLVLAGGKRFALLAEQVDATPLLAIAALGDGLSPSLRAWLVRAAPQAQLSALQVAGVRGGPLQAQGRIERLAFAAVGDSPGIDGLAGRFDGDGQGWELALDPRSALRFDWPSGFGVVHELQLDGRLLAWREGDGWEVATPALHLDGGDYGAQVRGGLWFQGDGTRPWIGIAAEIEDAPVSVARKFWIHHKMSKAAVDWLDMALQDGIVSGGRGLVAGDLDDWPFVRDNGRFEATATIDDGRIRFQEQWPELDAMQAGVAFVGNGFSVQGQGRINGLAVQRVQAGIADFSHAPLQVRAEAKGDAAQLLELLRHSPLKKDNRETLANLAASGPAATTFAMDLPLGRGHGPAVIDGKVVLDGAKLAEKRWNLAFEAVRGAARYDASGFEAAELAVRHQGEEGLLSLRSGRHVRDAGNVFEAGLAVPMDADDLFARAPELGWLAPHVRGRSPWNLAVALPRQATGGSVGSLRLDSSLVGTKLDLPAPLAKPADEALQTKVQLGLPLGSGPIDVAFGERLALRARQRDGQTGVRVKLGSSTVDGEPPASGLVVGGRTSSLDALEWIGLARGDSGGGPPLREIDVLADELRLLGGVFPSTRLKLRPGAQALEVVVDGPALAGTVTVPDAAGAAVQGHFARLHWQPPAAAASRAVAAAIANAGEVDAIAAVDETGSADAAATRPVATDEGFDPAAIPPLALDVDDLRYRQAILGKASLRTRPVPAGLSVERLQVQAGEQKIEATGEWLGRGDAARTHLALQVDSGDMGALMDGLGYRNWLARGEGQVHFDASWPGTPAGFSLAGLQGNLRIAARDGQLLEVEPGAGRVLGLFSLAQLPRRMMLDFRDFFSKGFAFDRLEGSVSFADGQAHTEDMLIDGPAADIRIRGDTDLRAQRFDQTIDVLPKSGNLLTVVGAVAGGPVGAAVGAAANAVLSRPLGELGAKTYRVSGPWKEPKVEVISREQSRTEAASAAGHDAGMP
ncbi:YhdP family protein [Pseudoxanthomonas daejeonensis]|uniref:TIGR02099 family protein n=1 Tax=Pseudoxanthomonas daejeonensis TaxID=266062 RepID=A0ABQ6Z5L9_9GAMM|nr:YhdP family protein [Pseudoxanthomonas daejeonensis]KAF1693534.1 TIGR02099 family protein [Pseudoxanthomonas daejeonensis]